MLGYMSPIAKDTLNNRYGKLHFLIGEYDVIAYKFKESSSWIKVGVGKASYSLTDTFIAENVEIYKKNSNISMHNTIGADIEKDTFHMQTLEYSSGVMDIYKGCIENENLVFCNKNSDIKTANVVGDSISFKLIYKQLSLTKNELIVGYSKDNCKTWFPYIKNVYTRK